MDRASFLDAFHRRMETFRRTGKMCDAKLIAKGSDRHGSKDQTTSGEFFAHMSVLSAASAHFEQVFDAEETVGVVELNIDADILEKLIVYMYTGHIQIDAESAFRLLPEAAYFQLGDLRDACAKILLTNITPSNCLEMWSFACDFSCEQLKKLAWKTACENFDIVSTSLGIVDMEFTSFALLIEDERLRCEESSVYTAVINWVRCKEERTEHLASLLSHVRLTCLDPSFLTGTVGKEPLIRQDGECFDQFLDALESTSDEHSLAGGSRDRDPLLLAWSVRSDEWSDAPSNDKQYISKCSVAVCDGALYCVDERGHAGSKLTLATGKWEDVTPKQNAFVRTVGASLFSFTTDSDRSLISLYIDETKKWETINAKCVNKDHSTIKIVDATLDGTTFYIGDSESIYVMNNKGECTSLTKLKDRFRNTTYKMCAVNGELYILVRDYNEVKSNALRVHIFDLAKKSWRVGPSLSNIKMPYPVNVCACADTLIVESRGVVRCLHNNKWQQVPVRVNRSELNSMAAHRNILFCVNYRASLDLDRPMTIGVRTIALDTTSLVDNAVDNDEEDEVANSGCAYKQNTSAF